MPLSARLPLTLLLIGAACQAPPSIVRKDVLAYLHRSRSWARVEAEAAQTIERILRTQFVDEAEIHRQIADSRPRLLAHLADVRAYRPGSTPVDRIHARYARAWETLLAAYDAIEKGFASGDYTRLARGREGITAWQAQIVRVADELRELSERFGVDPARAAAS
jgi:hypothetical protein